MRRPLLPSHLANTDPGNAPLPPPPFASLSRISQHQASSTSHVSRTDSPSRPPELGQCHRTSKIILAEFGIWWGDWPDAPTIDCADGCVVFCFCPKLNKSCMFIFIIFGSAIWALFILCSGGCKDDIIIHLITAKAVAFLLTS
ncbi:hypothetical protein MUK42_36636 [Musa troglodytarum]|uniref:Uncharacterized protein n=1 Tax=Musa troglodytarum TaxID=320322 RepID=A0A9E7GID5_9LILI|nr:hypothetical protein MUK42_36636 [Musa troglodytarum]